MMHYMMTQLSMKEGLNRWGKKGEQAVSKELSQLQFCDTFQPIHPNNLSSKEYRQALESHLFLKEK